jgi:hypothetical protein
LTAASAEQVLRRRSAVGVEAVEQPGVAGDRPGQQAAENRGLGRRPWWCRARSAVALTAGFRAGFAISAGLIVVSVLTAAALLREEGRGQRVNLIELQVG